MIRVPGSEASGERAAPPLPSPGSPARPPLALPAELQEAALDLLRLGKARGWKDRPALRSGELGVPHRGSRGEQWWSPEGAGKGWARRVGRGGASLTWGEDTASELLPAGYPLAPVPFRFPENVLEATFVRVFLGPQLAVGGGRSLGEERGRLGPEEGERKRAEIAGA